MLKKISQSLVIKTGIAGAGLAFVVALGAGLISYYVAGNQLEQILRNEMDSRARIIATHLENELHNIFNTLSAAAHNTLFANALADSVGRDNYLRPYLSSFQQIGTIPVRVVLSDFRGILLAANPVKVMVELDSAMLKHTVDSGESQFQLNAVEKDNVIITLTCPVLYANTGLPEGALTYQFGFNALAGDVFKKEENQRFRILLSGTHEGDFYSILQGNPPSEKALFSRTNLAVADIFSGWSVMVEVWEDGNRLKKQLQRLAMGYFLLGGLALIIIVPISLLGARGMLARLRTLEVVALSRSQSGAWERDQQKFPQKGGDEIASLGKAFNLMLDELNRAYQELKSEANREMKRQSERFKRVLSATLEGYVRIDMNTRKIEEVNEAFCRMLGQSCEIWEGQTAPAFLENLSEQAESAYEPVSWTSEVNIQDTDGKTIALLIHCSVDIDEDGNRQMVAFLTDISERKAAEAKMQSVNRQLIQSVKALEKRDYEITLLNRMNDLLLASVKIEEAFEVVCITAEKLFPDSSGALSILNSESQFLNRVITWGNENMTSPQFHIEECWGMRQGRSHEVKSAENGLVCSHLTGKPKQGSICVPLVVQGKTLGLLWQELTEQDDTAVERMRRLIISLGDAIKLAVSNLELREALQNQAIRDPLTELYNRRHFSDIIVRELNRAQRYENPLSLALIDLDHFKSLNDRFGHDAGDKVLIELGKLLREEVRSSDIAFRFGGEEFVLLLPETDCKGAWECLETLRKKLENMQIQYNGQSLGVITMSVGVAQYPLHGKNGEELIRSADNALYRGKSLGRNNVQMAE